MPSPIASPIPSSVPHWFAGWPWWISPFADVVGIVGSAAAIWGALQVRALRNLYTDLRTEPSRLAKIEAMSLQLQAHHAAYEVSTAAIQLDLDTLLKNVEGLGRTSKKAAGKDLDELARGIREYLKDGGASKTRLWNIYRMSN